MCIVPLPHILPFYLFSLSSHFLDPLPLPPFIFSHPPHLHTVPPCPLLPSFLPLFLLSPFPFCLHSTSPFVNPHFFFTSSFNHLPLSHFSTSTLPDFTTPQSHLQSPPTTPQHPDMHFLLHISTRQCGVCVPCEGADHVSQDYQQCRCEWDVHAECPVQRGRGEFWGDVVCVLPFILYSSFTIFPSCHSCLPTSLFPFLVLFSFHLQVFLSFFLFFFFIPLLKCGIVLKY